MLAKLGHVQGTKKESLRIGGFECQTKDCRLNFFLLLSWFRTSLYAYYLCSYVASLNTFSLPPQNAFINVLFFSQLFAR